MPPPKTLELDPRFIRTCAFATLHTPGYGTKITLFNGIGPGEKFATDFSVSMSAFDMDGTYLGESPALLELSPGGISKVDTDQALRSIPGVKGDRDGLRDVLGLIHLTPTHLLGQESCEVSVEEIMAHMLITDDFVEYYSYKGDVVTGVAYQTGPLNDARLSSTRSTTLQAPKVIVSDRVDTIFMLMNISTSFAYNQEVTLRFRIIDPSGETVAASSITVPPFTFRLLSTRTVLREAGMLDAFYKAGGVGTLYGLATNGSLVPLSMTRNDHTGAIAVDHTLPPMYYVSKWGGEMRKQGNARLEEALFSEEPVAV